MLRVKNYLNADWNKFRHVIEKNLRACLPDNLQTISDIENTVKLINQNILKASNEAIPTQKPSQLRYPYSDEINKLCKQRNLMRRALKNSYNVRFKSHIQVLNRKIKKLTSDMTAQSWSDKLNSLKKEDLSFYELTKRLKRKASNSGPLQSPSGEIIYSDKEKANLIANTFHTSHDIDQSPTVHSKDVESSIRELNHLTVNFPEIERARKSEVECLIKKLKTKKACGFDDITNRLIKNIPSLMIDKIVEVFNACLRLGYFPKDWKVAKVIALDKPGKDPTIPSNKRPISLLPVIGKLFEKVILERMVDFENANNIIIKQQFGFRSQHSTTQQLMRIIEFVTLRFNDNKSTGMVMLDIEKAFDSVWHDALVHKLAQYHFPTFILKIVQSFLKDRLAFVTLNGQRSAYYEIPAGTPQGSILSPRLFLYFQNDVPIPKGCKVYVFADDTGITASAPNHDLKKITETLTSGCKQINDHLKE